jgi:hypothetical protein
MGPIDGGIVDAASTRLYQEAPPPHPHPLGKRMLLLAIHAKHTLVLAVIFSLTLPSFLSRLPLIGKSGLFNGGFMAEHSLESGVRLHNFREVENDSFIFVADTPLPHGDVIEVQGLEYDRAEELLTMGDRWPENWQAGLLRAARDAGKLRVSVEVSSGQWLDSTGKPVEVLAKPEKPGPDLSYHVELPGEKWEPCDLEIEIPLEDLNRPVRVN